MAEETEQPTGTAVLGPHCTSPRLARLARDPDAQVRAQVAAHPNTPADSLGQLAAEFPAEVMGNPALPLLRLAHPTLLRDWPDAALLALIRLPHAPDWLRRHAANAGPGEVQAALASHPDLTLPEISALARHPAWLVRARIAARPDLDAALLSLLAHDSDYGVRLALASRPGLPREIVARLRRDSSLFVRQIVEQGNSPT